MSLNCGQMWLLAPRGLARVTLAWSPWGCLGNLTTGHLALLTQNCYNPKALAPQGPKASGDQPVAQLLPANPACRRTCLPLQETFLTPVLHLPGRQQWRYAASPGPRGAAALGPEQQEGPSAERPCPLSAPGWFSHCLLTSTWQLHSCGLGPCELPCGLVGCQDNEILQHVWLTNLFLQK
uniref:Uncharacterized protein n=1 Tax=Pan paniscus TaxID=9597 RepID=A0A2R8ZC19_PANPA